jgi:hypothetical protein
MSWREGLMLSIFGVAELVICGLIMYFLWTEDTTCDEVDYALAASFSAQLVHILVVALTICDRGCAKYVPLVFWLLTLAIFVGLAVMLTTAQTCETTPDFNTAFALVLAENLFSIISTCCFLCSPTCAPKLYKQLENIVIPDPAVDPSDVDFEIEKEDNGRRLGRLSTGVIS